MSLFGEYSGAKFSACRKYRYALWRVWDDNLPIVMFIGLNPSTANEYMDDPTIKRVKQLASNWGYGGVFMCNLFGYISPYPEDLAAVADPVGDNDQVLKNVASAVDMVVFAWGAFEVNGRDKAVIEMFPDAMALHINKDGSPKHPLYVSAATKPIKYSKMLV